MTLEQIEKERPPAITVNQAAEIMGINPQALRLGLQRGLYSFGTAIKSKRWVYWIGTERFIAYVKAKDLVGGVGSD